MQEIESLVRPVTQHARPCGVPYNQSAHYGDLEEAAREYVSAAFVRRDGEPPAPSQPDSVKRADWLRVRDLCIAMIVEDTKDLRLWSRLLQSTARVDGLPGLLGCVDLCGRLMQTYPTDLYPPIGNDGDPERTHRRETALRAIDVALAEALEQCVLIGPPINVRLVDISDAKALDELYKSDPDAARKRSENGEKRRVDWDKQIAAAESAPIETLRERLRQLEAHLDDLRRFARGIFCREEQMPTFQNARDRLRSIRELIEVNRPQVVPEPRDAARDPSHGPILASDLGRASESSVSSKDQSLGTADRGMEKSTAIAELQRIAQHFRTTEPHSPVPYLLELAVRWANKPLPDWLAEVVPNGEVLAGLRERLGVAAPDNEKEEDEDDSRK